MARIFECHLALSRNRPELRECFGQGPLKPGAKITLLDLEITVPKPRRK